MCRSRKKKSHYVTDTHYINTRTNQVMKKVRKKKTLFLVQLEEKCKRTNGKLTQYQQEKNPYFSRQIQELKSQLCLLTKVPKGAKVEKTRRRLFGPGHEEIKVLGKFKTSMNHEKIETKQETFVIEGLHEPFLGRPAMEALNLITRINEVKSDSDN